MNSGTTHSYRSDIDGLRAVAILLVAVFHFKLLPIGGAGFIGVDIFFVISGFLITRLLMRDVRAGQLSLKKFYVARLRRLMPALIATLVLYFIAAAFVFLPDQFNELSREALLTQLYVVNFYFWRTINYFGLQAYDVPLLHMWSLAIEEQFYLFFPIALLVVYRIRPALVLPALVLATLGSFLLGWWGTAWKPEASFYLLPTRAWELTAGAILALVQPIPTLGKRIATLSGLIGIGVIATALAIHTPVTAFPGWFAILPVIGSVCLILSGPSTWTGKVLSIPPMLWIGRISYPLYLVHWPVIQIMRGALPEFSIGYRWVGFAISIVLAWMIWRFVERPIRFGTAMQSGRSFFMALAGSTAILGTICVIGIVTEGLPNRVPEQARSLLAHKEELPTPYLDCLYTDQNPLDGCKLGAPDQPVTVALIGDSHAQALAGAFDQFLTAQGLRGTFLFYHGCRPVFGYGTTGCRAYTDAVVDALRDAPQITQVIMVSTWRYDVHAIDGVFLSGTDSDDAFATKLEQTLAALDTPDRDVILVDPMFSAPENVPERMARNIMFGRDLPVDRPLTAHLELFETLFSIFDEAAVSANVQRISLIDDLCRTGTCQSTLQGKPLFRDNNHIRFGVSDYFSSQLDQALGGRASQ